MGEDLQINVPTGTLVYDDETGELLADLVETDDELIVVQGGLGGRGNATYKTAIRRAPDYAQPGIMGEERHIRLELKVLADVGLVGLPNVGKSSLIRKISASQAVVANYPFTTLVPNLGVVSSGLMGSYVVSDIPGLVPGAHQGAGLGHQFLRHVERTRILVHVVSASPECDPLQDFELITRELSHYSEDLVSRCQVLLLNKIDLIPPSDRAAKAQELSGLAKEKGMKLVTCSCITGEGVKSFQRVLEEVLYAALPGQEQEPYDPMGASE